MSDSSSSPLPGVPEFPQSHNWRVPEPNVPLSPSQVVPSTPELPACPVSEWAVPQIRTPLIYSSALPSPSVWTSGYRRCDAAQDSVRPYHHLISPSSPRPVQLPPTSPWFLRPRPIFDRTYFRPRPSRERTPRAECDSGIIRPLIDVNPSPTVQPSESSIPSRSRNVVKRQTSVQHRSPAPSNRSDQRLVHTVNSQRSSSATPCGAKQLSQFNVNSRPSSSGSPSRAELQRWRLARRSPSATRSRAEQRLQVTVDFGQWSSAPANRAELQQRRLFFNRDKSSPKGHTGTLNWQTDDEIFL